MLIVCALPKETAAVLSLFDSHAEDPLSLLTVTTAAFGQAGRAVARAGIPVTIIQEGGYQTEVIGDCLEAFLTNLGP